MDKYNFQFNSRLWDFSNTPTDFIVNGVINPKYLASNFDVESADWSADGVTDQASFESFVLANSNYTSILVENFVYSNTRIKCNIYGIGGTKLQFPNKQINKINSLGFGFDNLSNIELESCLLTEFNPISLPNILTVIILTGNLITIDGYTESLKWAYKQSSFLTSCNVVFSGNIDSVSGTDLEAFLQSYRNCTVTV